MDEERPRNRLWLWGASLALLFLLTFFYLPCVPWPPTGALRAYAPGNCGWSPRQEFLTPLEWMDRRPWRRS